MPRADLPPLLMVFLKAPRLGEVKTRLAREIGDGAALAIYRRLAEEQLARLPRTFDVEVTYAPRGARAEMRAWLGADRRYRAQVGGGLGERLAQAFAAAFARGYRAVFAIGADCPGLDGDCLLRARALLARHDAVIGPADDGGYYLLGLRRQAPGLFRGIDWSTASVLAQTRTRLRVERMTHALLETKSDVDTAADLRRWEAERAASGGRSA